MPIASINLITIFIVEQSSNIFQGFCNRAPNSGGMAMLLPVATATAIITTATTFIFCREAIACSYFSKAFSSQDIADID